MKNFKYFQWGYSTDSSGERYAVYQPLLNCFLIVVDTEHIAKQLKYLLSSRYTTAVVRIDRATNYTENLIDNSVCESWTLKNTNDIQTFTLYESQPKTVCAETLILVDKKSLEWNIDQEKQWIFLCLRWLYFFESLRWQYKYYDIDVFLKPLVGGQIKYYPDEFREEVLTDLYLNTEFERIDQLLLEKINACKDLYPFWKSYIDNFQ